MSTLRAVMPIAFVAVALSGCIIEEHPYREPPACRGAAWVEGHYGPRGAWHPGHWRCPGVVERAEVD